MEHEEATHSSDESSDQTRSDSIATTGSDVISETGDDACSLDEISVQPAIIRVSSPGLNGSVNTTEIAGSSNGQNLDSVNLNISVKVNDTKLTGRKVKDEPSLKEQTIDVAPELEVKAVAKEDTESKADKESNYTIDLQFTINMDKMKKGNKLRRRRHKSADEVANDGHSSRGEAGDDSEDHDLDLGEGAVGGDLSDVIPEEPEGQSEAGTPRGGQDRRGNGELSPKEHDKMLSVDYLSGYDSGYFDYGRKQTTDVEEQSEADAHAQPVLLISGSQEEGSGLTAEGEDRESQLQQDSLEKFKRKSKSDIRKERAKRLKDKFSQPPRLVLRRSSAADLQQSAGLPDQSQGGPKVNRRYSVTSTNEQHKITSSDEEVLDDVDTGKLDTLIMLNKLRNFLKKGLTGLNRNAGKQTVAQSSQNVVMNGAANYAVDLDNGILDNLPMNIPTGHDLDTSFTTEDGEHSGEVTPRNAPDTDEEEEELQESSTPRNTSPNIERRSQSRSPHDLSNEPSSSGDNLEKQTAERKTRLTRQSAKEDYFTPQDLEYETSSQTNTLPLADDSMRPGRIINFRQQMLSVPSIEVSNENDETVEVVKPKAEEAPRSPKIQRAKSESAVSQGLLAPYCKLDMGNGSDSDEVFTLSAHRSPHFRKRHGQLQSETLRMDATGRTRAEIVLNCDHPENLTPEELGIKLGEGEELRVLPVLVLDAESTEADVTREEQAEFPHTFAPIGIIPLTEEKADLTDKELDTLTEKAEEILKDTDRGQMFQAVPSPNFTVNRPKAPTTLKTKVLRRAATEAQAELQTKEEPALPVTMRNKSPLIGRRALSECGSPRGSPRVGRRELYKEFFEPTRRVTRAENELCSPIEKTHQDVMDNLNQMQFDRQISGEDISTSGLGGYHKDFKHQRRESRESVSSDSSSGGSKEEQKSERVFVFPPGVPLRGSTRNNVNADSDRDDTASVSSGSTGTGMGDSIRERRKSLEEKFKQDLITQSRAIRIQKTPNFSSVRDDLQRKLSDGESSRPVLDGNRTRKSSEPKMNSFERPPEYSGVRNKFEKLIAHDGTQSPTLSRRPQSGLAMTRGTQFSKTTGDQPSSETKKPEQTWTWKQREAERSKSDSLPSNSNNSNSRTKSCPAPRIDDEWFMPNFEQKLTEKERPRSRDVSPFRDEDTDWFFDEIKPEAAVQNQLTPDAWHKRHQWSAAVQSDRDGNDSGTKKEDTKSKDRSNTETKPTLSLNSNNNAHKTKPRDDQDWLFLRKSDTSETPLSPARSRRGANPKATEPMARSKSTNSPSYGLTIQAKGKHERSNSAEDNYGLTLQTTARPRTVSQGSEADDVFLEYPGTSTPRSSSLLRSASQPHSSKDQNPFMDYKPVGRHQPIVIDGRTPPRPLVTSSPRMTRAASESQRSKPTATNSRSVGLQHSPRPQMSRSTPSQSSKSGLAARAMSNSMRSSPSNSRDSRDFRGDCQHLSMTSVDSGWFSERLDSTMSDVFDLNEQDGYTSDTTETPRPAAGQGFFSPYDDLGVRQESGSQVPVESAITQLMDENDGYGSDDELFRQRCIDVFKTLHHEDVVYQQFQKLLRFRQRRISLHKDNFKIIPKRDDRSESDSDGNMAYLV